MMSKDSYIEWSVIYYEGFARLLLNIVAIDSF